VEPCAGADPPHFFPEEELFDSERQPCGIERATTREVRASCSFPERPQLKHWHQPCGNDSAMDSMDRPLEPHLIRQRRRRRVALTVGSIAITVLALAFLPGWLRPSVSRARLRFGRVEKAAVEATLDAAGVVVPAAERSIASPVETRVLSVLKRAGDAVHIGDPIVVLDTSASRLDLARLEDRIAQKASESKRLALALARDLADLDARAESKRLDAQMLAHRVAQREKLRTDGLVSDEALEEARIDAEKARIEVRQLEGAKGNAERSSAAQLEGVALDVRILEKEADEARRQLELATARADMDGIVTWVVSEVGATVRVGQAVAKIARLDAFRIEATISDVHAARLGAGMTARIEFSGHPMDGTVANVLPAIEGGAAKFLVDLSNPSDPALRQNLRVDVHVVSDRRDGVLSAPRGPFATGGAVQPVFVVRDDLLIRRSVRVGLSGYERLEIVEGLEAGDTIVLSDMQDYTHLESVRLTGRIPTDPEGAGR
jgi:HlyD family secretion protein